MSEAEKVRELQRSESEARDIIHDIDRLNTFPENKKSRWVWELLQNAKDVAGDEGVDITYELKNNEIIFSHNGLAFETEHLLAILYKTSTKSLNGVDGTTGKYGTGFVTTHILSKKVSINGIHYSNEDGGLRSFKIDIDRSAAALDESESLKVMKQSLTTTFQQIDKITENPSANITDLLHSFIYPINPSAKKYAISGLDELERNIPFVLLINKKEKKHINSVTIIKDGVKKVFQINPVSSFIDGLNYIEIENKSGILYKETESIIFGLPVINNGGSYSIESIEGKSVLYKEFPLIGSENFNLPLFIQHKNFKPTEERDGLRTKKEDEVTQDATADNNRICLKDFINEYLPFITILIESNCNNLHLLALSGLPEFTEKFHNEDWYLENIQKPIRKLISEKAIVKNAEGNLILIKETRFPIIDLATDEDFFELLEELIPDEVPSSESLNDWNKIINQEHHNWNNEVTISLEQLLEGLPNYIDTTKYDTYQKLKKVYLFLETKNSKLGESYPIYLNEKNEFKTRLDVSQYPEIDDEIKFVSKQLGKDLDDEFLNKQLGKVNEIKEFNLLDFYKSLNSDVISPLKIEVATEEEIKALREEYQIKAAYKMVDTCAAEFAAATPYYYSVYGDEGTENEAVATPDKKKILVLGSGPIRIGQGIEFDFCSVHCTWAFAKEGYETIIINNNPETVSTDFDIADKLYFEPLTPEDVENVVNIEKPDGAVVQFGGQTAIKLTEALTKMGVKILGTSAENVDAAEDRELFDEILEKCEIPRPKGQTVFTAEEAKKAANELGYPVLVRPSYVLGGQGMRIAVSDEDVEEYIGVINQIAQEHPILVDKYLMGKEIEVDAVCDGEDILIPGIMEHIERAGIHSGDSISVYPAKTISEKAKETIAEYTRRLARALHVIGMINIQFIVLGDDVYVIEVNPRSSRTVPYISKVTGIPIVPLATKVILGYKLKDMGYEPGLQPEAKHYAIKMPVFSFEKIRGADISLGPEMKSTGECLGIAETFNEALYKAFIGAGIRLPKYKNMIITVKDEDKQDIIPIARRFEALGYRIYATLGTAKVLKENGIKVIRTNKLEQPAPNLMDLILGHKIDVVIDTPPQGVEHQKDGFVIRRNAIETGVNVLTSLDTAEALATSLENTDLNNLSLIDIATIARR